MRPADLANLQLSILATFGEAVEVLDGPAGAVVWSGQAAIPADVDVLAPDAELAEVVTLRRLAFPTVDAPDLPIGTHLRWRESSWVVDANSDAAGGLLEVLLLPGPPGPAPPPTGTWWFRWLDIADAPPRPRLDADLDAIMNPQWIQGGDQVDPPVLEHNIGVVPSGWPAFLLPSEWLPAQIAAASFFFPPWYEMATVNLGGVGYTAVRHYNSLSGFFVSNTVFIVTPR